MQSLKHERIKIFFSLSPLFEEEIRQRSEKNVKLTQLEAKLTGGIGSNSKAKYSKRKK